MDTNLSDTQSKKHIWLNNYPKGVPKEINPDSYPSLVELMDESFKKFAGKPAFANMGTQITFGELDRLSRNFASFLQNDLGMVKGDRLAIQMPNLLQYPIAMYGAFRAGLVVVNTNPLYTPREMEHQFKDSGAKAIVILANFASNLEKIIAKTDIKHVIVTEIGDMMGFPKKFIVNSVVKYVKKMVPAYNLPGAIPFSKTIAANGSALKPVSLKSSDIAYIQYTGGTTGVSKGAMLTHRNVVANVEMNYAWMLPQMNKIKNNIMITALPLYHIYSLTVNALSALKSGYLNVLITNPRDMKAFIKDLKKYQFSIITGLNTLYNGLLNQPDFATCDFSDLKITSAGGMALQNAVAEKWKKVTGCPACEGYGLSETSPVLSSNPVDGTGKIGSIGIPWPNTELKIVKVDGTEAAIGERGEIWAKGPQVMPGYWNRPDETAMVLEDGWFKTGDIGIMDEDGYFKIVDRKKDMILVSGFNVYPNEIEDVVAKHPGVLEVACIGIKDERSTEAVKIFVVKKEPDLTEDELKKYCRENLTGYKIPKHIEFRTDLPKSNVGKILRRMLKENAG
ncbi:AMP-binding protein [Rhodocytophaga aerolata]|uniref:Long-chain-fatty-acid--CoA ligase n=1 Tax=Rhodocytophaga aerolata TaxID=455078 RepID=A0ABT8R7I3_9BACT|nr:AMP-binding protein [Rhodocytophaga aerolata]MDO1447919.1 AMP-binding protein [Rhodocytophaga aerolata]